MNCLRWAARWLLAGLVLCMVIPARAQNADFWRPLLHSEALLDTLTWTPLHFSSWARNGGNNDLGQYEATLADGWKLLADADGPGVITGLWFTQRAFTDPMRFRIYIDDTLAARIDTPIAGLFGRVAPFLPPLADTVSCAIHSAVPIPFQSHVRITYSGPAIYYHVDLARYPAGTVIPSFTWPPSAAYLTRVDSLRQRFLDPARPAWATLPFESATGSAVLVPGARRDLVTYTGARGCRRWLARVSDHSQSVLENVWLRVYTDDHIRPDLEGPLSALFGAMLGWWPYQSFLTGSSGDSLYLNLPTRFDRKLRIEVQNLSPVTVSCTAIAELVNLPANATGPLRLRSVYHDANPTVAGTGYNVADVAGRGHYAGLTLDMQTRDMRTLEGDETIFRDGAADPFWHGTGTEDYFSGGYFWCGGTRLATAAHHGCTHFQGNLGVSAYRACVTDPVPFQSRFQMRIEVGPYNELAAHYRSAAFFYLVPERWQVDDTGQDGGSFPGEPLHIAGYDLPVGATLSAARLGIVSLALPTPLPTANAAGVLDFTTTTPSAAGEGTLALTAVVGGGPVVIDSAWEYHSCPDLSFHPLRVDADSFAFALDTLAITLRGIAPYLPATVYLNTLALPWLTSVPVADSLGVLRGQVRLPVTMGAGDHALRATSMGTLETTGRQPVRLRNFYRVELETLPATTSPGVSAAVRYAPDYAPLDIRDPWDSSLVCLAWATNPGAGSYFQTTFSLPLTGRYRLAYFFGRCAGGATLRAQVDGDTDVATYDSYTAEAGSWRWLRSDTVRGSDRALTSGLHTLRFEILGRNAAATDWQMILDQIVFEPMSNPGPVVPVPVRDLTIAMTPGSGLRLRWRSSRFDTAGYPLESAQYLIYRSVRSTAPVLRATITDPDTQWVDTMSDVLPGAMVVYYVLAHPADSATVSVPETLELIWRERP